MIIMQWHFVMHVALTYPQSCDNHVWFVSVTMATEANLYNKENTNTQDYTSM